jgi:hypothetical protein
MLRKIMILGLVLVFLMSRPAAADSTKETATQAINNAESVIFEMQKAGFGVTYANDTLNEARLLFGQGRYMAAETVANKVPEIREAAINVSGLIDTAEARIYDLSSKGYNVSDTQALFNSGLAEFKIDNYVESESAMNQVIGSLDEIETKESIKKTGAGAWVDLLPMILDYLWLVIIAFLAVLIAGLRVKKISKDRKVKNNIKGLEREKIFSTEKIREAQKKYFERGVISKADYETMLVKSGKELDEIKNELSVLKERR